MPLNVPCKTDTFSVLEVLEVCVSVQVSVVSHLRFATVKESYNLIRYDFLHQQKFSHI